MGLGFGQAQYGRNQFGGIQSDIEPRFIESDPADGETGVSVLAVSAKTSVYGFSSRVVNMRVEISENGEDFVDAYVDGAFVAPYNGLDSFVDYHQADPQLATVKIEKTDPWDEEIEVILRITAYDDFDQQATKEAPVVW